jgi:hypothetical protein
VLVTAQQTALALGVAALGSVFTTLAVGPAGGMVFATVVAGGIMAVLTFGLAFAGRALPRA